VILPENEDAATCPRISSGPVISGRLVRPHVVRRLLFATLWVVAASGCGRDGLEALAARQEADAAQAPPSPVGADPTSVPATPKPDAGPEAAPAPPTDAAPEVVGRVPYRATAIALGSYHACALLDDGHVKCWGSNSYGQLGLGDATTRSDPSTLGDALPTVDLGTGRTAVAIAAGRYTSCAALDDGSFKCWGWPGLAGLGASGPHGLSPGTMGDALPALDLGAGRTIRQVGIGTYRAFGVLDDGSVVEWSSNPPAPYRPASASPAVVALTPARGSAAALLADGTVEFLDPDAAGGPLAAQEYLSPAAGIPVRAIGGNDSTLCIAPASGGLRCAGGVPSGSEGASPSAFAAVATTALGYKIACGLRDDGQVACWGGGVPNPWWGNATSAYGEAGTVVALDQPAKAIASGSLDLCALLADGSVKCWSAGPSSTYGLAACVMVATDWRDGPWLPVDLGTRPSGIGAHP
jgi:hypothetical protein